MDEKIKVGDVVEIINWSKGWNGLAVVHEGPMYMYPGDWYSVRQIPMARVGHGQGGFDQSHLRLVCRAEEIER